MAIMSGTFDGITVSDAGDLDIGHMMQSFIGDGAAFKLRGNRARRRTPLYAKIPLDGEEMFESGYTIDDLLIGKVGIVGICKGKITPAQMKSPSITSNSQTTRNARRRTTLLYAERTRHPPP